VNVDEHIEAARKWAAESPNYRSMDMSPADCYAKANYHLLLAILEKLSGDAS